MGTIKAEGYPEGTADCLCMPCRRQKGRLETFSAFGPRDTETGVFMKQISGKIGNRTSETVGPDASFYRTAAVCLAVYLMLALAGACAIAAERMGWETPPGEYYEMETDMTEFEGPLEEIGRIR